MNEIGKKNEFVIGKKKLLKESAPLLSRGRKSTKIKFYDSITRRYFQYATVFIDWSLHCMKCWLHMFCVTPKFDSFRMTDLNLAFNRFPNSNFEVLLKIISLDKYRKLFLLPIQCEAKPFLFIMNFAIASVKNVEHVDFTPDMIAHAEIVCGSNWSSFADDDDVDTLKRKEKTRTETHIMTHTIYVEKSESLCRNNHEIYV